MVLSGSAFKKRFRKLKGYFSDEPKYKSKTSLSNHAKYTASWSKSVYVEDGEGAIYKVIDSNGNEHEIEVYDRYDRESDSFIWGVIWDGTVDFEEFLVNQNREGIEPEPVKADIDGVRKVLRERYPELYAVGAFD